MSTRRQVSFVFLASTKQWMKSMDRMESRIDKFGNKLIGFGGNMTRYLTAPTIGAGLAATKMASDFDLAFSRMIGLVGLSREEVQGLKQDVLDLAGKVRTSPIELAEALYFITSAGFRGAAALEVLELSAKASASGLGETKTVADLVTSAVNAYGPNVLSAAHATDVLVGSIREGKAEAPEFVASMGQVLPLASNMGITFDQVAGAMASMTRTGTDAGTAAIQLRQILASLLSPSAGAEQALEKMGTSSANLRRQLREEGLVSVLGFLATQMKTNEQAMAQVFGNVRALSGALDIMGANADENVQIFKRLSEAGGELEHAFNAAPDEVKAFKQAITDLQSSAIEFGGIMLPIVARGISAFAEFASRMNDLSEDSKLRLLKLIGVIILVPPAIIAIGIAAKGAALGISILNGLIGITRTVAMGANAVLFVTNTQIKAIAASAWLLTKRIFMVLGIWASVIAAFAAGAVGAQWLIDNWIKLRQSFQMGAKSMEIAVLKMVRSTLQGFKNLISFVLKNSGIFGHLFGFKIEEMIANSGFGKYISELDSQIYTGEQYLRYRLKDFNENTWGSLGESADNAIQNAKKSIMYALKPLVDNETFQKLKSDFDALFLDVNPEASGSTDLDTEATTESLYRTSDAMDQVETKSKEMSNGMLQGFNATSQAANTFANSFGSGLTNIIVEGEKLVDVLENIGKLLLSSTIQMALSALLTGGLGGTGFLGSGGGLIGKVFGVNDALIRSDGSIVRFHPNDNILAMQDFGDLQPAAKGVVNIEGNFERAFRKALDDKLSSIGPEEFFILSKKGGTGY